MLPFLDDIIKKQKACYFISPHFDDAVLSAGGVLSYLSKKTQVTLVTVFTQAGEKPYTRAAQGFLRDCGISDAKELYRLRREEEQRVCNVLAIKSVHLGCIDGSFRRKTKTSKLVKYVGHRIPEVEHLYPLGRKMFSLARDDRMLAEDIKNKLLNITKNEKNFIIFCPLGTVKHMDHIITHDVCQALYANIIYWTDYPYIQKLESRKISGSKSFTRFSWKENMNEKKELVSLYKTQIPSLFPDGDIKVLPETYIQVAFQTEKKNRFSQVPRFLNRLAIAR